MVGALLVAFVGGVVANSLFDQKAHELRARQEQDMKEEAKQWARENAERKVAAHEEALKRERQHQQQLEDAWGGPAEAAWKNPDLNISQMLEQLARACAPPSSPVTVRVDRFTDFELTVGVSQRADTARLAGISQCLMPHAAPYLRDLRFIQKGRVQVELDSIAIDSVLDWQQASTEDIERLITSVEADSGAGGDDANPAEANVSAANPAASNDEPELSGDSKLMREAEAMFNRTLQENNARLNEAIKKQGQATMLGDVHTAADLEGKIVLLQESKAALDEVREFFLNEDRVHQQLVEQAKIDPLLADISARGVSERQRRRRPYLEQLFQALAERQRSATTLLIDMKSLWGGWSGDSTGHYIRFTSVSARDGARTGFQAAPADVGPSHGGGEHLDEVGSDAEVIDQGDLKQCRAGFMTGLFTRRFPESRNLRSFFRAGARRGRLFGW